MSENIYLTGIGGIGMSNLAVLLKEAGYSVSGSDEHIYDPAASILREAGIAVKTPYRAENIPAQNCPVVIGNALSRGHVEVEEALRRGHALYSFPEILGRKILRNRLSCVIAGTHGKSTTSACLAHLLQATNQQPGYLFGAQPLELPSGAALGKGAPFVVEGDEYDSAFFDKRSKFLHYFPRVLILGAVEYDHADIFPDLQSMLLSFSRLLKLLPDTGRLIYNGDSKFATQLAQEALCETQSFGVGDHCDWRLESGGKTTALRTPEGELLPLRFSVLGLHNQVNSIAALAAANAVQSGVEDYLPALESFRGIRRRMEILYNSEAHIIIDDFAHHPTAVAAAIRAARDSWPERHLTAVFEPRSNTSVRNIFPNEFAAAFAEADRVIIGTIHREARIPAHERLDFNRILSALQAHGKSAYKLENPGIIPYLQEHPATQPAVILFMSNGSFDNIPRDFAKFVSGD